MVYSAWMHQAMEGRLLFENRFTTDPQPGLTLHLYFLVLGWLAKVTGIPVAMHLGRLVFAFLAVISLGHLIEKATTSVYSRKLSLAFALFGSGIGFLVWHVYGVAISKSAPEFISSTLRLRLPIDVWQPEGFFFPSGLTNGLFMVSAWLIFIVLNSVLDAKESKKSIIPGMLAFGVLMNIHSYDVLIIGMVLFSLLIVSVFSKDVSSSWIGRTILISLGVVPAALWFVYVLKNDTVFQARAATLTYAAYPRALIAGYILMLVFSIRRVWGTTILQKIGALILFMVPVVLWFFSGEPSAEYQLSFAKWASFFGLAVLGCVLRFKDDLDESTGTKLIFCWAFVGLTLPYFPALFQRKLTMLLIVPWGILAGMGIAALIENRERGQRNLLSMLTIILSFASGIYWLSRETLLAKTNVSNTTVHNVYLSNDVRKVIGELEKVGPQAVIAALPGIPNPSLDEQGNRIQDSYSTPVVSDLNSVLVGLAGVKAFAGHWSETPNYDQRRNQVSALFSRKTNNPRVVALELGITHIVVPTQSNGSLNAPSDFSGKTVIQTDELTLIEL